MSAKPSIDSIFCSAIEIESPDERRALVEQACGEDVDLKQQVERLLHAHFHGRSILDAPVQPVATSAEPLTETAGTVVGPYKLIERIGEGGMGTVWMAQQTEPVKRLVAVKLIKAGMDSKQVLARFEAERQALAIMDHPNIAKVLDGGTAGSGRPYFVMDLVKGLPITKYCDEHHLTPRQRLELFIPVCQAVQHAHQKGVIHRDLKPSNVLVALYDGKPVPKVIDFGVAKAAGQILTNKTLVTGFGDIVGTLEYMSPEQAEINQLDIDTRSDIYSLGVLLYELLAGSPPFSRKELTQAGMLEMLRVIREQEPSKPSTKLSTAEGLPTLAANRGTEPAQLTKLVRGELDWIVMKALEKDRNRRYESAAGFAADVDRYLRDEAVLACPPSVWYRFRKSARRNRRTLITTALLGAMLLAIAGILGWTARDRAAQRGRNAEAISVLLDWCENALRADQAAQAAVTLDAAERRAADGGAEEQAGRLARCRADLGLLRTLDDIDTFRWTCAGGAYPKPAAVVDRWRAALADYGVSQEEDRSEGAAERVNGSLVRDRVLAALDLWLAAKRPAGGSLWVRTMLRSTDPNPYRDAIRDAVATFDFPVFATLAGRPEALDQPPRFAVVLGQLYGVPAERGRAVLKSALRNRPGDLYVLMGLGDSYLRSGPGGAGESVRWYQAAVAAHPGNVAALNNLGVALARRGDPDGAVAAYRDAIRAGPAYAIAHHNLGCALQSKGDLDGALVEYRDALRIDPGYIDARFNVGGALWEQGNLDGALACFKEAARLHPKDARAHNNVGYALQKKRDWDRALAEYREAIRLDPNLEAAHSNLAWLLATGPDSVRDGEGAVEHATRACELTAWKIPLGMANLAAAYAEVGDFGKAIEFQKKALSFPAYEKQSGKAGQERLRLYERKMPYRDPTLAPRAVAPLPR